MRTLPAGHSPGWSFSHLGEIDCFKFSILGGGFVQEDKSKVAIRKENKSRVLGKKVTEKWLALPYQCN